MDSEQSLLRSLADGESHVSRELAQALGISTDTLRRHIQSLCAKGIEVLELPRSRYRLSKVMEFFEASPVLAALGAEERALLDHLDVLFEVDSTNRFLCEQAPDFPRGGRACLADRQTAARGRRGRAWVAPLGNVYLSILWTFGLPPAKLQGLSLAVGVATARVASAFGADQLRLKWPNDVVCEAGKLGGILIEIVNSSEHRCQVVIGIGLNVAMVEPRGVRIDQPWTDLSRVVGRQLSKNAVAGCLLAELLSALRRFELGGGFSSFHAAWEDYDHCRDKMVVLHTAAGDMEGVARGVDEHGRLLLEVQGSVQTVVSGDISLRVVT